MTTTDVQIILTLSDGTLAHMWANGFTDTSETEIQVRDLTGTAVAIGNALAGKVISRIQVQCSDGSYAGPLKYISYTGQVLHWWYLGERTPITQPVDADIRGLAIKVRQGDVMKITTQD
jgi:hypothetical protein